MKRRRARERGFNLVEMTVIVAVLVIIGGALTPVVVERVQKRKDQAVVDDFRAIEKAVSRYHVDVGTFAPLQNIKGFDAEPAGPTFKHFIAGDGEQGWNGPYLSRVKTNSAHGGRYDVEVIDEDKATVVLGNRMSLGNNYDRVLVAVNDALDGDGDTRAGVVWGDREGINFGINYAK
jgi:type II secretory pathway pseudopilin PulG